MKKRGDFEGDKSASISSHFIKYSYIYLLSVLVLIILATFFYFYSSNYFKPGEIVYSKEDLGRIGTVQAFDLGNWGYIVVWSDGSVSGEKKGDIDKISKLDSSKINNTVSNKSDSGYSSSFKSWNNNESFGDYIYQSSGGVISGILYRGFDLNFQLGDRVDCQPNFMCGEWSACFLDYGVDSLINNSFSGIQYKSCMDNNVCLPNLIDSRACSIKENITALKKYVCGYEQIELVDSAGTVVARLNTQNRKKFVDVSLNLLGDYNC